VKRIGLWRTTGFAAAEDEKRVLLQKNDEKDIKDGAPTTCAEDLPGYQASFFDFEETGTEGNFQIRTSSVQA